jgi:hypothetical protein
MMAVDWRCVTFVHICHTTQRYLLDKVSDASFVTEPLAGASNCCALRHSAPNRRLETTVHLTCEGDYTPARYAAQLQLQLQFVFVENVCHWRLNSETEQLGTFVSSLAAKSDDNHLQLVSLT